MNFEDTIPEELHSKIIAAGRDVPHFERVYRVAKWGKLEKKAFYSTYREIIDGIIPDDDKRYPRDEIGTYSTSVYIKPQKCKKYIKLLCRKLRDNYPCPKIIVGKTSHGLVQKTIDRKSDGDSDHVDWWIYDGAIEDVMKDFIFYVEV